MTLTFRPSQIEILRYRGGKMGISAVPGAGKTFTLSALAAQIITSGALQPDQDILIVTLVNSAVNNFASRIGRMVAQRGLIPHLGYRVRTLHGLAHDIVREKPALVGLEERFQILDDQDANAIIGETAHTWLASHASELFHYIDPALDEARRQGILQQNLPNLLSSLAQSFIRLAKDRHLTPDLLRQRLDSAPSLPLAQMGCEIYANYQRALAYRGALDFADLIRLAHQILEIDTDFLARLQYRFPYVLEDEAQDSSRIQEEILRKLAGHGNWVRVGDPNQAIFETFTTADPRLLKDFIAHEADYRMELPVSGRSQPAIIALANQLIDWVNTSHPVEACREALTAPHIQPTAHDDPQPNPPADPGAIRFVHTKYSPEEEAEAVAQSLAAWLPEHADWTVAVLVARNARGIELVGELKKRGLPFVEMINSTLETRNTAGAVANVLSYLADPASSRKLALAYQVWRRAWREADDQKELYAHVAKLLREVKQVEAYLFPAGIESSKAEADQSLEAPIGWPFVLSDADIDRAATDELLTFREVIRRWQGTTLLPTDQMILTLSQELFTEPADLALAHKLALVLRQSADQHPEWRLPELTAELSMIAKNERRFIGFSEDDSGFDPERHRGKVVVTTMHKAKGLEWERVYLMSVNNYDFPSLEARDTYIGEKWFVRDSLNLEAEALGQLKALEATGEYDWYEEGAETQRARLDYVRERLRLLYVALTRAKRELILTWNLGRKSDLVRALPVEALAAWAGDEAA